jgi:hypothetical protein
LGIVIAISVSPESESTRELFQHSVEVAERQSLNLT